MTMLILFLAPGILILGALIVTYVFLKVDERLNKKESK